MRQFIDYSQILQDALTKIEKDKTNNKDALEWALKTYRTAMLERIHNEAELFAEHDDCGICRICLLISTLRYWASSL